MRNSRLCSAVLSEFDTNWFGRRFVNVDISREVLPTHESLWNHCASLEPHCIVVKSDIAQSKLSEVFVGELVELTCKYEVIRHKFQRYQPRFNCVMNLQPPFSMMESLVTKTIDNRFSRDAQIGVTEAAKHKLHILETLADNNAVQFVCVFSSTKELLGVHVSKNESCYYDLYEIMVDECYRSGFLALDMILMLLRLTESSNSLGETLKTRIYRDNVNSMNFFKKLGFLESGKNVYQYHLWK